MFTMNKIFETYDVSPTIVETVVPERLRKHNSIEEEHLYIFANNELTEHEPTNHTIPIIIEPGKETHKKASLGCLTERSNSEPRPELSDFSEVSLNVEPDKASNKKVSLENYKDIASVEPHSEVSCSPPKPPLTEDDSKSISTDDGEPQCDSAGEEHENAKKLVNLALANIVEFDRSDMSSDSEPENGCRRISLTRRRLKSFRKSISQEEDAVEELSVPDVNNNIPKRRQRRKGVSAESVRVSWSSLRETFKNQQRDIASASNIPNENDENTIENSADSNNEKISDDEEATGNEGLYCLAYTYL